MARAIKADYGLGQVKEHQLENYKARIDERNREKNGNKRYQEGNNKSGAKKIMGQDNKATIRPNQAITIRKGASVTGIRLRTTKGCNNRQAMAVLL